MAGASELYVATVRRLEEISSRHAAALASLCHDELALHRVSRSTPSGQGAQGGDLETTIRDLEDAAILALARLARKMDYADVCTAIAESGTADWLVGAILSRGLETVGVETREGMLRPG